jgi:hypothetical protein
VSRNNAKVSPVRKAIAYTWWYLVAGSVAIYQFAGTTIRHPLALQVHRPTATGWLVLGCLAWLLHPPLQPHHWIRYGYWRGWKRLLNPILYVVGLLPVSGGVNYAEYKIRHWFHIRGDAPEVWGTLIALPTVGLMPLWVALIAVRVAGR